MNKPRKQAIKRTWLRRTIELAALLMLSACGGGGTDEDSVPTISIADVSIVEGDSGNSDLIFTISGSIAATADIEVDYTTSDGTATQPDDYLETSGTAIMPAGATRVDVVVPIVGDLDVESDETFTMTLSIPTLRVVVAAGSATGTITNDDAERVPALSISDVSVSEGTGADSTLTFVASLDFAANSDVTADFATMDDSAVAPEDYDAASGSLLIAAGDTTASIPVTIIGDALDEANETFTMTLSNISAGAIPGVVSASGTIDDDDEGVALGTRLNDTGFTQCSSDSGYDQLCNDGATGTDLFPGQDAEHGRDFTDNDDNDGHAGFSFTKLDADGTTLVDQTVTYTLTPWSCVRDEVTELVWEVKTDNGDIHDQGWSYSWYNSSGVFDGGEPGVPNRGVCLDSERCDTEKFTEDVNADNYCGFDDWRLPSRRELLSLLDYSANYEVVVAGWKNAFIDSDYFPNTNLRRDYWSATAASRGSRKRVVAFAGEPSRNEASLSRLSVRLVRGGN